MAINYGMHRLAGSIGNETHYIDPRTGKEVVRRKKPTKVRNPRSDKQREHRNHFLDIVHLSSKMREAYDIGLKNSSEKKLLYPYTYFRKLNKDCFTADGAIDYSALTLSYGTLSAPKVDNLTVSADGTLQLSFSTTSDVTRGSMLYLYAYSEAAEAGWLAEPTPCTSGVLVAQLPDYLRNQALHVYLFFVTPRGKASPTSYHHVAAPC
ncbi:MAG: hypothetical protein II531_05040 [Bacteroidales bacterium]|nr:hypothetical protein [Bacteroidales bacterium]